ncbi:MAG: transcription antitermination factor NusB [Bacteriovoracaceae bacterium]|jgi:transcription antitermination protein NusB|nr:transcription antitermination factor NusB [Bacteriovoracaceae bacterium]
MNSSNNTLARDFTLKFLFHLRLDARADFLENLKTESTPLALLEQEWNDFNQSYTETDIEHPNNQLNDDSYNYSKSLINTILSEYDTLTKMISSYLQKRTIDKVHRMDFWILMIGSAEFLLEDRVPHTVVLNEAIELAKKYGDNDSYSFINGVLDKLSKDHFS